MPSQPLSWVSRVLGVFVLLASAALHAQPLDVSRHPENQADATTSLRQALVLLEESEQLRRDAESLERDSQQLSTLRTLDMDEARLAGLKPPSAGACEPADDQRLAAEVALWAMTQRAELALDAGAARAAAQACRLEVITTLRQDLVESREQLMEMALAFGNMHRSTATAARTPADPSLELADWMARLEAHRGRLRPGSPLGAALERVDAMLATLRRQRDALLRTFGETFERGAPADAGPGLSDLHATLERVRGLDLGPTSPPARAAASLQERRARLDALVEAARPLVEAAMACGLQHNAAGVAERIGDVALVVGAEAARLERLAHETATRCATAASADRLNEPSVTTGGAITRSDPPGLAWLPPPETGAPAGAAPPPAVLPTWLPSPAETAPQSTLRAVELVDRAREILIQEEQQRIIELRQAEAGVRAKDAELRLQQALDRERQGQARDLPLQSHLLAPPQGTNLQPQTVASTPQQAALETDRRVQRRASFAGLLGRVTSAVATRVDLPPAVAAALPAISALASGDDIDKIALPQVPGASAAAQQAAQDTWSAATSRPGAPEAARDPFAGSWTCTTTPLATSGATSRSSTTTQTMLHIVVTASGHAIRTAQGDLPARADGASFTVQRGVPISGGSCQQEIRLQLQGTALVGAERVSCSNGERIDRSLQCRR